MKIKDIGETGLIERISRGICLDRSVVRGVGDDAAVIKWTSEKYLLYTCDMLIEGVHFRRKEATPFQIGWKALGRNISDIAAMGGLPRYAVVSAAIDPELPVSFAQGLYEGIRALASKFGVNLVGGDTCRSKRLVMDVSLIGEVERKNLVTRNGARPGDLIMVTGTIGGAHKFKHLRFLPRVAEARTLVKKFKISSMIDISDGLAIDLWRVLQASGVGARISQDLIPVSRDASSFERAISDGEDFELLFTMRPSEARRLFALASAGLMRTPLTLIGEIMPEKYGYTLITRSGRIKKLDKKGYLHF
ncbi:MAG: thiamine-phosphate kinase [Candidatus Omnitrophica bacterium]|nr:thiamine-phosphate kinase [Candidatus Omnitrophota bacterium]